jgi:hypothetical protein
MAVAMIARTTTRDFLWQTFICIPRLGDDIHCTPIATKTQSACFLFARGLLPDPLLIVALSLDRFTGRHVQDLPHSEAELEDAQRLRRAHEHGRGDPGAWRGANRWMEAAERRLRNATVTKRLLPVIMRQGHPG